MKYVRYLLIMILACLAFMIIDDVSALSLEVVSGSCTQEYIGYYDVNYVDPYIDLTCTAGSEFRLLLSPDPIPSCETEGGCTFVNSVVGIQFDGFAPKGVIAKPTYFSSYLLIDNYSFFDFTSKFYYMPNTYPTYFKSTILHYMNRQNYSLPRTAIIKVPQSGHYFFTFNYTVMPGNQFDAIQSSANSQIQQETNEKLDDVNQSINDVNDSLTSTESPDIDGLGNTAGWLPAGPVDSILNLPLVMLNSLFDSLSSTCEPVVLPLPFVDKDLELPCINSIYAQIGNLSVWVNSIGLIIAGLILYKYLLSLYQWVDDTLSFRENNWNDTEQWGGI